MRKRKEQQKHHGQNEMNTDTALRSEKPSQATVGRLRIFPVGGLKEEGWS
jgi:hypothetical protein